MGTDAAIDRVKKKLLRSFAPSLLRSFAPSLLRSFDHTRAGFDRIELPGRGSCCIQYARSEL